ncbi:carbohydrate ABC transporter permease [Paenibacillus sp. PAMC21692]|uniref:carbohydrate ABC transporter permease n=1 Tax=Paenibacillus sp. PAMC21692 TaxID=2762320 RepID=UPI00164D699D|nr:carbohydrate ABC transporter permease [Paenibacillus sp. PAMC21692]QNK59394.1 carbohydrate ABC transporter permease [Paenibacillus sp. PAMC21692]
MIRAGTGRTVFQLFNYLLLAFFAFICVAPLINVLSVSLSESAYAAAGSVKLWPVHFTIESYVFAFKDKLLLSSYGVSIQRVIIGVAINMFLTILVAYPLSKEVREFRFRTLYAWFLFITILFHGGLIPWYVTIRQLNLMDSIWALVLPSAVPVFNCILLLNFFRQLPKELQESAHMDGAGHWTILWRIMVPLSKPALATLVLFACVNHWNSWFDGLILMKRPEHYPLQTYLQTKVISFDASALAGATKQELESLMAVSDRTLKAAQIFLSALPIMCLYPFLQKYFVKGIVMGSVKE